MSRLIDADLLKAEFTGNFHEMWHYTGIWAMIDCTPTAYDTDRVIEQLDNEAANNTEFFTDDYRDDYYRGAYAAYCEAIEIVKRGGRNDSKRIRR